MAVRPRQFKGRLLTWQGLFGTFVLVSALSCGPNRPATSEVINVIEVIDGDTIRVDLGPNEEVVRLLGIDTPEATGGPRPVECGGDEASEHTKRLLPPGTAVDLARDVETRDQYGRLLAFVVRVDDGLLVNQSLIESGHATALFFAPNTAQKQAFERTETEARVAGRGVWGGCEIEPSS